MNSSQNGTKSEQHYAIVETKQFRKDKKRLQKAKRYNFKKLEHIVRLLAEEKTLPTKHKDHSLKGVLVGHRECHIEGDWLLTYRYEQDELVLVLVRSGTHSQLFN